MRPRLRYNLPAIAALAMVTAALAQPTAAGATADAVTVNSTLDPGDGSCATNGCTLREAMNQLNDGDIDQDHITIAFSGIFNRTITLAGSLPVIDEPLTVNGAGLVTPVIDGNDVSGIRPFTIDAPVGADILLSGLQITGARDSGVSNARSELTIADARIAGNQGGVGGGVRSEGGRLTIRRTTVADNHASLDGGGVLAVGHVTVERSTISDNGAGRYGGGVSSSAHATTIASSTISGNRAFVGGGGVALLSGSTTISDTTITANSVPDDTDSLGGGGIYADGGDPAVTNTIVAGNTSDMVGPDLASASGVEFQLAFSLVGILPGAAYQEKVLGSNVFGLDPQLGPLAANGGPTFTHLLAATSPAIDRGSTEPATDQRLIARPQDDPGITNSAAAAANAADIGAVELPVTRTEPDPGGPTQPASSADGTTTTAGTPGDPAPTATAPLPTSTAPRAPAAAAAFGTRTLVTLALKNRRLRVGEPVRVRIVNRNGFPVSGRLSARTTNAVAVPGRQAARRRRLTTVTRSFRVAAGGRIAVALPLSAALRTVLTREGRLSLRLLARVDDTAGSTRQVMAGVTPLRSRR